MARPTESLIGRDAAAEVALALIDAHGLQAFSLPKLARKMGVGVSSLYHHFADRSALLEAVALAVLSQVPQVDEPTDPEDWADWLVTQSLVFQAAVQRHRHAAPLLVQYRPRDLLADRFDQAAALLGRCGVPAHLQLQILDATEIFALGSALTTSNDASGRYAFTAAGIEGRASLAAAVEANTLSDDELRSHALRNYLLGLMSAEPVNTSD